MIVIDRNAPWIHELAWSASFYAELGHSEAVSFIIIAREYLHSMIIRIDDEQETSMMVERQTSWKSEHAIGIAIFHDANRELDSSISIKSIASHVFQFNLSKRQGDTRERRQATSNEPNEPIDEGTKNSTSHPPSHPTLLADRCLLWRFHFFQHQQQHKNRVEPGKRASKRERERDHQRNEKISNSSSFGIIDIAESSTTDRIIVIVDTACLIHDGAYRWRAGRHVNVSASH